MSSLQLQHAEQASDSRRASGMSVEYGLPEEVMEE